MEKLTKINTRADIEKLQKNDTINITLTRKQAQLIGFALSEDIENGNKCLEKLREQAEQKNLTSEQKSLIFESQKYVLENILELEKMRDNLKKYYSWLVD